MRLLIGEVIEKVSDDIETKEIYIPSNIISTVLKVIGGIEIIIGMIFGLIVISSSSFLTGIGIVIAGVVVGFIFLGFGEVINLLHQINERQKQE